MGVLYKTNLYKLTMTNPIEYDFSEEQLAQLHALVERETKHAYDQVAEGIFRATREFASCFADLPLPDGTTLELDSPEYEQWAEGVDEMVSFQEFQIEGFDASAYFRKLMEARLATSN